MFNNGSSFGGQQQGGDYNRYPEHSRNSQYPSQQQGHVQGQGQGQGQGNAQSLRNAAASHQPDATPTPSRSPLGYFPTGASQSRLSVSELVQVPPELSAFAADPQFQQILLKVKEQSKINFITVNRTSERSVESISITAPTDESALLARKLVEIHFKQHMKIMASESRLQRVQTDLFTAQGGMASGMIVDFTIDPDLVGIAIGKKGVRIKQVEKDSGVSSVNVDGKTGHITVVGPDAASVQQARELLELFTENHELKPHQIDYLSRDYGMLADIKATSDAMVARVERSTNTLIIIGTNSAVRSVRLMLDTQMEYVDKQIELEMTERKAREDLNAFKKQYNYFSNSSSSNRADGENNHRDREGNRDRDGHRGDRDRNHTSNGNRSGRGGGGGVEGNGAWGHHDEDHRDNRGEKRDGNQSRHGNSNSKGNTGERNQRSNSGNTKEKDTGKVNTKGKVAETSAQQGAPALSKSRGRAADTEAPLIAIPPPSSAAVGSDNSSSIPVSRQVTKNRSSRVKSDNYDAEDQRDDNANSKSNSRNRRRTGAAVLNVVDSQPVAGLNVNTGDTAFALVAAAAAARNAPKMEKKNGSSIAQEASTEPLEKLLRKPRNSSTVKEGKSPDSSATTFTVVLPSNPPAEGKSDAVPSPKREGGGRAPKKTTVTAPISAAGAV